MIVRAREIAFASLGGAVIVAVFYGLVLGAHMLEQLYPCRATDVSTGESRAVSCIPEDR